MIVPAQHAVLSASGSHRWLACPGSIRMSERMPNESSIYAREGSAAHEIGEMALRSGHDAIHYLNTKVEKYSEVKIDHTLCAAVQQYLDMVRWEIEKYELAGYEDYELGIEIRFDLTHIDPDMFGTCDCILYFPAWKRLHVIDYKHGWSAVAVERNPQTMYYALGALTGKHNREVDHVELVIVQPRTGKHAAVKRWGCDVAEIFAFKDELLTAADKTRKVDSELHPGEWCKFCPAAAVCGVLAKHIEELVMIEENPIEGAVLPNPEKIPFEKLKSIWDHASMIEAWVKNVKSYCHQQALAGNLLPGTKLVEGRSNRDWVDEASAMKSLQSMKAAGEIEGELFISKLKSPAQVEDMLPKKVQSLIASLWTKGRGALTLVAANDPRAPAKVDVLKEFS